jgi:hypothetical protein
MSCNQTESRSISMSEECAVWTFKVLKQFSDNSRRELTNTWNIDRKALNNIPEAVNKLAFSASLGNSCETGWNIHDSSYYSKQNSVLSQGKILGILATRIWYNVNNVPCVRKFTSWIVGKLCLQTRRTKLFYWIQRICTENF